MNLNNDTADGCIGLPTEQMKDYLLEDGFQISINFDDAACIDTSIEFN